MKVFNKVNLPVVVADVVKSLNENVNYAILRNHEGLPYENSSRDIDILIERKSLDEVKDLIVKEMNLNGFSIVSYFDSERMCTFICGKIGNTGCELVQFDFFFHTSAYGIILQDAPFLLQHRLFDGKVYFLPLELEFLDKYLYLKFIGSKYPSKYEHIEQSMHNNAILDTMLKKELDISCYEELQLMSTSCFRRKILFYNMKKKAFRQLCNINLFYKCYVNNFLFVKGFSFGFTGPDGAGKTTILEKIIKQFNPIYKEITFNHFRPLLFRNLGEVANSAGLTKEVDCNFNQPHRGKKTGKINSFLRLSYYTLDYVLGYILRIRKSLFHRGIVIFDRYYTDIICDSRRSRIYLSPKFLYLWKKCFIPSLDYNFLLTAQTDTILSRKKELDEEGIKAINEKIDYLARKKGYIKILNDTTPQDAVLNILNLIFEKQHKKNLKRLK